MAMTKLSCWILGFVCLFVISGTLAEQVGLRIMNYNVRQLPIILGFNNWDQKERLKRLPATILKLDDAQYGGLPEVLFLNELMTSDSYWDVMDKLLFKFPHYTRVAGASCKAGDDWNSLKGNCNILKPRSGVMAMSVHPILERHAYIYEHCDWHTSDSFANKGAVYVKIEKQGHNFHVIGTHMQADEPGNEETAQIVRSKQIVALVDWIKSFDIPKDEPIIFTGDFNIEWGSKNDAIIDRSIFRFDVKDDYGFGSFSGPTNWLAKADLYHNKISLSYDELLDYVLQFKDHKLPLQPAWMEMYQLRSDESWYWKYLDREFDIPGVGIVKKNGFYNDVSDHWPVLATFMYEY